MKSIPEVHKEVPEKYVFLLSFLPFLEVLIRERAREGVRSIWWAAAEDASPAYFALSGDAFLLC